MEVVVVVALVVAVGIDDFLVSISILVFFSFSLLGRTSNDCATHTHTHTHTHLLHSQRTRTFLVLLWRIVSTWRQKTFCQTAPEWRTFFCKLFLIVNLIDSIDFEHTHMRSHNWWLVITWYFFVAENELILQEINFKVNPAKHVGESVELDKDELVAAVGDDGNSDVGACCDWTSGWRNKAPTFHETRLDARWTGFRFFFSRFFATEHCNNELGML